ncbi:MAG: hypothetical protein ABR499_01970 [Gemmatimonadaceae bacterium]
MSSDETKQPPERRPLQFDTAEPTGAGAGRATSLACTVCGADISTSYYEVNGSIACISCRAKLGAQFTGGSGSARFAKAIGFGLIAAAAGSALYYAILKLTGYEIGLVAIVVGFLVGTAVRRGSQGRGGRAYQVLAVGLTYFAIVTTYIPFIVNSIKENPPAVAADSTSRSAPSDSVATASAEATTELQGTPAETPASKTKAGRNANDVTLPQALLGLVALLALAAAAPILAGFQNIIGMLIISFALYEAWRQNQPLELAVTGPYRVATKGGGPSAAEAAHG